MQILFLMHNIMNISAKNNFKTQLL